MQFTMCLTASQPALAEPEVDIFTLLDLRAISVNGASNNGLNGGLEPLRFDKRDSGLQLGQAILGANVAASSSIYVNGYVSLYNDDAEVFGVNELYIGYRPFPIDGYRLSARAGIFFPEISLENTAPGWTATNVISNSAINTWVGEEIKNTGIELKLERLGKFHLSSWDTAIEITAFEANDPAGALLAWRGWGLHDRQVRYREKVSFAALPSFNDGAAFSAQTPYSEPNLEVDGRTGYSASLSFTHSNHFGLHGFYYDNNANPDVIKDGQYAWHTRFFHLGLISPPLGSIRVKAQYLTGNTKMGKHERSMVDADYRSWYTSIDHSFEQWRYTLRYDSFKVEDIDITPMDTNRQDGYSWTMAAARKINTNFKIIAEALLIRDRNYARKYSDTAIESRSEQFQITIQWRAI